MELMRRLTIFNQKPVPGDHGVGSSDHSGNFFPTFSPANPMRSSRNGKGAVNNYYQPGRRY